MDKQKIITEIQHIAKNNGGIPPGSQSFQKHTGIKKSEWYPFLWLNWGEALIAAGYQPNKMSVSYNYSKLILHYIDLIREISRFPLEGDLRRKGKNNLTFPSHNAFRQLGSKVNRAEKILEYCNSNAEFNDVKKYCLDILKNKSNKKVILKESSLKDQVKFGFVYLIQHGNRQEYKIGKTYNVLRREGEIRVNLPETITPIHTIQTDDPSGVEQYWHRRFSNKRKKGEWFSLSSQDVASFKRWKKIT
tara:strand:+ start:1123 stop:1863 length:741 start_codon:yes stop_codon:yes gene_type:complete